VASSQAGDKRRSINCASKSPGSTTADDLAPKTRKNGATKYQDPNNPHNSYSGKGKKPLQLVEARQWQTARGVRSPGCAAAEK
jgi:hypothetical protein